MVKLQIGQKLKVLSEIIFFETWKTIPVGEIMEVSKIHDDCEHPYSLIDSENNALYFHAHNFTETSFSKRFQIV